MGENKNELFGKKTPGNLSGSGPSGQEDSSIQTITLPKKILIVNHFIDSEVPSLVKELRTGGILLDFGCGNGSMISIITQTLDEVGINQGVQTIGYDPHLPTITPNSPTDERQKAYGINFTDNLPERADVIIAHFSLHHTENMAENFDRFTKLGASFIAIAEYDFSPLRALPEDKGIEEFKIIFQNSEAGRKDYTNFLREAKQNGKDEESAWRECFRFHIRYSKEDFKHAMETSGFNPVRLILPGTLFDKYKFTLTGKRK